MDLDMDYGNDHGYEHGQWTFETDTGICAWAGDFIATLALRSLSTVDHEDAPQTSLMTLSLPH
jgi:hypothetical protein